MFLFLQCALLNTLCEWYVLSCRDSFLWENLHHSKTAVWHVDVRRRNAGAPASLFSFVCLFVCLFAIPYFFVIFVMRTYVAVVSFHDILQTAPIVQILSIIDDESTTAAADNTASTPTGISFLHRDELILRCVLFSTNARMFLQTVWRRRIAM